MRNPLKRLARPDQPKRLLRERLAGAKTKLVAVREKYGRTLRVHRALNAPLPIPAPAVDRAALVNYATFLWHEHRAVCGELYPHLGHRAGQFVRSMNEAWGFFHDGNNSTSPRKGMPPASTRAVQVLDLAGVDWRKDLARITLPTEDSTYIDSGERPSLPFGWPAADAVLTEALDDLRRLDAGQEAMHSGNPHRNGDTVPGYDALEDARDNALDLMAKTRAESLTGLQAKAAAILTKSVSDEGVHVEGIAASLARDLIGAHQSALDQNRPDPIFAVIDEAKRLFIDWTETGKLPLHTGSIDPRPENVAAQEAFHDYVDDVLLETVPTTAAGSKALARYAVEFIRAEKFTFDETSEKGDENVRLLDLIARSPLRA
ncbi:hypothetical protein [Methylobacterium thuringiense]|uniref:Uncharacterized protein n=1 Tax=Methylobacterium thuringiense TaxID=1003091 RepID=A0ABQ4TQP9_9HYPH|nr:hypothetical protein [Methylobacterium thuringiense]GJE57326.1 hypothetical protein EKPJFOCH_3840 [Methylobacterium thuringiense]